MGARTTQTSRIGRRHCSCNSSVIQAAAFTKLPFPVLSMRWTPNQATLDTHYSRLEGVA